MRLLDIKTVKKAVIYGALNNKCFSIKTTPYEFEELKKTGVLIEDISVYDTFISVVCCINTKGTQDLISKAISMGIQIKYFGREF